MSHLTTVLAFAAQNLRRALAPLAILLALASGHFAKAGLIYSVGEKETIYTASQRKSLGLNYWPDGNFGVAAGGSGNVQFYAANSSTAVRTTGTLTNPGQSKQNVSILGTASGLNYVAGGPIYQDATTGTRLLLYHAEKHYGSSQNYASSLGLAVARDSSGLSFQDLGLIVESNQATPSPYSLDLGGGSLTLFDNYLYVHYRDYLSGGASSELAVARAPLSSVLSSAAARKPVQFSKYYNGTWSQPGRGGLSSPLEAGNPANAWSSVAYNDYLNQFVMVSSQYTSDGGDLYMAASPDGVNWSPRQAIAADPGEQFYPSLVGTGVDPSRTGQSFYVYYTDSNAGAWNRWNDAQLARRQITFDPAPAPPPSTDWTSVSSFLGDYQTGTPAAGWNYLWNPTGKTGNSSVFTPLKWSSTAGVYNTTGGATQTWSSGAGHVDDYLNLSSAGGHPGKPGYNVITSYTIQADDGAGKYRLTDGTVAKSDSTVSSGEDGLNLLVYVNNTLMGASQSVSTNGSTLGFTRDLGQLTVGDTVYVMVNAGANQNYDSFRNFDFTLQRGPSAGGLPTSTLGSPLPGVVVTTTPPVTLPTTPPVTQPTTPPAAPPPTMVWTSVSTFVGDYQTAAPAAGWKYLWNPTGKTGASSTYAPLKWSNAAGAYNTTGAATQVWTSGTGHVDDYLNLSPFGGHPGQPGYNVIAAYTIQADDGAGQYQLANGTISKTDSVASSGEDGLSLLVYINNTLLGSPQTVSTNGTLLNFSRDLGTLAVGDTIYVMINAGKNQNYDSFKAFDFAIQKLVALPTAALMTAAVPEPASGTLLAMAVAAVAFCRRRPTE